MASKVLFFTKGPQMTVGEALMFSRLQAKGYDVKIRNSAQNTKYGTTLESCDAIAGEIPAGYEAKPSASIPAVAKPEAFNVFPAAVSLGAAGTQQLVAISADLNEALGLVVLTDMAADPKVTYASADDTKCTVDAAGLITRQAAGGVAVEVTATYESVAATKALIDRTVLQTNLDTEIEATTAGTDGNDLTLTMVGDGVAKAGTIDRADKAFTIHFQPHVSTVTDVEALITGLGGPDDLIAVKTGGTGATVLEEVDAFTSVPFTGGAAAIVDTAICEVTTT
jgi:hypothetical protein